MKRPKGLKCIWTGVPRFRLLHRMGFVLCVRSVVSFQQGVIKAGDVNAGDCIYVHSTIFMSRSLVRRKYIKISRRDIRRPYVLITGGLETVISRNIPKNGIRRI